MIKIHLHLSLLVHLKCVLEWPLMDIIYRDGSYADTLSQCLKLFKANPDIWKLSCLIGFTRHMYMQKEKSFYGFFKVLVLYIQLL